MKHEYPPHPLNVIGPFYVENGKCATCCFPETKAPALIGFYTDPSGTDRNSHCYIKKQPDTTEELEAAIAAVAASCCDAYRYGGDDPAVILRLLDAGVRKGQIDRLESDPP